MNINFAAISQTALIASLNLLESWLPNGKRIGDEYVAINPRRQDSHRGSFKINLKTGFWSDFAIGVAGGDFISLYAYLFGCSQLEAAQALNKMLGPISYQPHVVRSPRTQSPPKPNEYALAIWRASQPVHGTVAETYLRGRGISMGIPLTVSFHPGLLHTPTRQEFPTMVVPLQLKDGTTVAIQRTYLAPDGSGKAGTGTDRMTLGPSKGAAVNLAPCDKILGLCEGVETALSVMQLYPKTPVWCALGASNLKHVEPPDTVRQILIYADADAAGQKAAQEAAQVLAIPGRTVKILTPSGKGIGDFNDVLRAGRGT